MTNQDKTDYDLQQLKEMVGRLTKSSMTISQELEYIEIIKQAMKKRGVKL